MRIRARRSTFICGENLAAMRALEAAGKRFALAYLDPPFMTGRVFRTSDGEVAYRDVWPTQVAYERHLEERFIAVRALLIPEGTIVVHVDPTISHRVRCILDAVFGRDHFASEIVWRYRRWPAKTPNFQAVHDVLIRYRRSLAVAPRWTQLYEPLAASTLKAFGRGRQLAKVGANGRRTRSLASLETMSKGAPLGDVWETPIVAPSSNDRVWPTAKPLPLLSQLIVATTDRGDAVLEPYAGSGTASIAAHLHGRSFTAIDSAPNAMKAFRRRALNHCVNRYEEIVIEET